MTDTNKPVISGNADAEQRKINWDDSNMRSTYANVSNVASTREEVMLLFGTSQVWSNNQDDVRVKLSDRIIMSPYAAMRLKRILDHTLAEYERLNGKLG